MTQIAHSLLMIFQLYLPGVLLRQSWRLNKQLLDLNSILQRFHEPKLLVVAIGNPELPKRFQPYGVIDLILKLKKTNTTQLKLLKGLSQEI
jgi:hypothetical protein